jgi:hypothetical protein
MPYCYGVFGLVLESCFELAGLENIGGTPKDGIREPDVTVVAGHVPEVLETAFASRGRVQVGTEEILVSYAGAARFLMEKGRRIVVDITGYIPRGQLSQIITGTCLGAVMQQRGWVTFHGSAVDNHGKGAVLFIGQKGSGKSTLAALLARKGYELLSDDLCPADEMEGRYHVYPGMPAVKLCGISLGSLGMATENLSKVTTHCEKFIVPTKEPFRGTFSDTPRSPRIIDRIYVLGWGGRMEMREIPMKEAVPHLMKNIFRKWMIRRVMGPSEVFERCARIAKSVPVYSWERPLDSSGLGDTVEFLLDHLESSLNPI